jgi:hypothetical protein
MLTIGTERFTDDDLERIATVIQCRIMPNPVGENTGKDEIWDRLYCALSTAVENPHAVTVRNAHDGTLVRSED